MEQTLKELAGDLQVIHESLERAEAVERQLGVYWREFAEERDQLRAEVERLRGENLKSRLVGVVDGFEAGASSEVKELEATVAGLRRALEEIASDGVERSRDPRTLIAQTALAASSADHARRIKSEALREAATHCEETELLMPIPEPRTTLQAHGANVCMAMAAELRAKAAVLDAMSKEKE